MKSRLPVLTDASRPGFHFNCYFRKQATLKLPNYYRILPRDGGPRRVPLHGGDGHGCKFAAETARRDRGRPLTNPIPAVGKSESVQPDRIRWPDLVRLGPVIHALYVLLCVDWVKIRDSREEASR